MLAPLWALLNMTIRLKVFVYFRTATAVISTATAVLRCRAEYLFIYSLIANPLIFLRQRTYPLRFDELVLDTPESAKTPFR